MRAAVLETHGEPLNITDVEAGDWVAVHGCGGVELSAAHVADVLGTNVVAVDLIDEKLDRAQELGAVEAVDAEPADAPEAVQAMTDGGADVSGDALGVAETRRNSVLSFGTRGRHVQIGPTTQGKRRDGRPAETRW